MFVSPQNSYIEILTLNVMVVGGGAFGRWLDHERGALMDGISTLIKEAPENSLTTSTMGGHSRKTAIYEPGSESSPNTKSAGLNLKLSSLEICKEYLLFKPPSPWCFAIAARID